MNTNLLNAVNALKAEHGADVLDNPGALERLFETARDEPRAQIKTLITACVRDFHKELQNAAGTERAACKDRLAQKLHNDEALDLAHCKNTLDLIEAVLFGAAAPVCAKCGAELKAHWKACPECGTAVQGAGERVNHDAPHKPANDTVADMNGAEAHIALAGEYAKKKDYGQAIAEYTKAIQIDSEYAAAFYGRGKAYYYQTDYDAALNDFNKVISLDPNTENGYAWQRQARTKLEDATGVTANREVNKKAALTCFLATKEYYKKDDYPKAILGYTKAIKLNPNDADVYYHRGNAYFFKGDYDEAIEDFTQAIELNPYDRLYKETLANAIKERGH